jgi:hypothetical protein
MATDMGLARYSEKRKDWDYYTRASGLPSDQIQSIAFGDQGELYAGTQCDGIAMAGPDDNYTKWRTATGELKPPQATVGEGLVSNQINAIGILPADESSAIVALTPDGVSGSPDGDHWAFIRSEKFKGAAIMGALFTGPGQFDVTMPAEDWMTCLAPEMTHVWVGFRKRGVEERDMADPKGAKVRATQGDPAQATIRAILALPGQAPLIAGYDEMAGGLLTLDNAPPFKAVSTGGDKKDKVPDLPAAAPAPRLNDFKGLAGQVGKLSRQIGTGEAFFLADDWRTRGDWVGRYGSGYVKLCGMGKNGDQDYPLLPGYEVSIQLGPHHEASTTGPAWHHDNDTSEDLGSLYDPTLGHRRDAEENDASYDAKTYPESYDGPDLWVKVKAPEGVHCLSLYFLNNDAHRTGDNKYRDYDVQVLTNEANAEKVQASQPLSRTRVTDFWGGVYKQFLIRGPASYVVRIGRNRSHATRLHGVFLDPVTVVPPENPGVLPGFEASTYEMPEMPTDVQLLPLAQAAVSLWSQLDDGLALRGAVTLQMPFRIWCYRAAMAGLAPPIILERWRWQISIWTPEDRKNFDEAMKAAHDAAK